MFSGIIEEVGEVVAFNGESLEIKATQVLDGLQVSESIAVSGACLTVTAAHEGGFSVEVVPETRLRTNFDELKPGSAVNLERSLRFGDRVGGHIVQGHVDGVATVRSVEPDGNSLRIWFDAPEPIMRYIVEKGFIAIDGISLTIVDAVDDGFSIALIPYTRDHTTLGGRGAGDRVNIEVDATAKYVERYVQPQLTVQES